MRHVAVKSYYTARSTRQEALWGGICVFVFDNEQHDEHNNSFSSFPLLSCNEHPLFYTLRSRHRLQLFASPQPFLCISRPFVDAQKEE